jgi:hypothetical protein
MVPPMAAAALLAVVLAVSDAPSGGGERGPRWFGLAFGTAVVSYRPLLGDPLRVVRFPEAMTGSGAGPDPAQPSERKARFWLAAAPGSFLIVTERHGAVAGIEAFTTASPSAPIGAVEADPSGVRLGSTLDDVVAKHPAAVRSVDTAGDVHLTGLVDAARGITGDYRFAGGRLVADAWFTRPASDGPQLPGATPYVDPAGDGETTAILDAQANERDGVAWEYLYLRFHPCDGTAAWRPGLQSVRRANERVYDVIETTCPSTGAKRAFFFDITPYYGKM